MATRRSACSPQFLVRSGFTLIELLVVIGIIAILISLLLPVLAAMRSQVRATQCQNNVMQLVQALNVYAAENEGHYPPNFASPAPGAFWYDAARIGKIINPGSPTKPVEGGIAVCPEDELSQRSYAMNIWASSKVDKSVHDKIGKQGALWGNGAASPSRMILIAEAWATISSKTVRGQFVTNYLFGYTGLTPGLKFGGGTGVSTSASPVYGHVYCELPYVRHRGWNAAGLATAPHGRVSIGYADGHVELKSDTDLVDSSGKSTLNSLWSTWDVDNNN